jgi:hypothetical protein
VTLISPLQLWRRWLPAHLGAYVLAAVLGGLVEFALEPNLFEPGPPYHTIGDQAIIAGLLIGGALAGVVQGLLLRRAIPNWWRASQLGALAGLAVTALTVWLVPGFNPAADAVALAMPMGMFGQLTLWLMGLGLVLGLAQWRALRRHYGRAAVWIVANLVATVVAVPGGWLLSLMWGMPLAMMTTLVFSSAGVSHIGDVLGGVVVAGAGLISYGALVALITGLTLRWVLARPIASTTKAARGPAAPS